MTDRSKLEVGGKVYDIITMDAETAFGKDYTLSKMSTSDYVRDPRFHVHCWSVKIGEGQTKVYFREQITELFNSIDWSKTAVIGHNLAFDGFILHEVYGIHPGFYIDTLSMARAVHGHAGRHNLDTIAKAHGLAGKVKQAALYDIKDKWDLTEEEEKALALYATDDVDDTFEIFWAMYPFMPDSELRLVDMTMRMFCDPVLEVDIPLVEEELKEELGRKMVAIEQGGVDIDTLMSNEKFAQALRDRGVEPPMKESVRTGKQTYAFSKADLEFQALGNHPNRDVKNLYFARLAAKSTIGETRAGRFIETGKDGQKLPVMLHYSGAHTHRWSAGNKMNMQNLPKKGKLRRAVIAPKGYALCVMDSAQIEARGIAWLAGEQRVLDMFRDGTDLYIDLANDIFGKPEVPYGKSSPERTVGKVGRLGLGFGMGSLKFKDTLAKGMMGPAVNLTELEAAKAVSTFRTRNPKIVQFWAKMDEAITAMILGRELKVGVLEFGKGFCRLPNGLFLHYEDLQGTPVFDHQGGVSFKDVTYKVKAGRAKLYGGLLAENVTQAIARIIVAEQMLKMQDAGLRVVMMTHDEVVTCVPEEKAEETCKIMQEIMSTPPDWAAGYPLNAEGGWDICYSK